MKNLFILIVMFISIISFSQKLIIKIQESNTFYSYSESKNLKDLLDQSSLISNDVVNTQYVIDLDKKTSSFYRNGKLASVLPINIIKLNQTQFQIEILEEGFDYGLIVDTNIKNESVIRYVFYSSLTEINVMTNFEIIKPS
jgi:hypothetical protein